MAEQTFQIDIDNQSVNVRLNSPYKRFYVCMFFISLVAIAICALLFLPGKHGNPSMWHDLSSSPVDSGDFIFPVVLLLSFPFFMGLLLRRYIVSAYPSDETFQCDRSMLTVSKVRWLDFKNNHWETRSYTLGEIQNMRYQAIASAKATSIYGLRFNASDRDQRVLPGLKPRDADKILKALRALGVDVPDDPRLASQLAKEANSL